MAFEWQDAFLEVPEITWVNNYEFSRPLSISTLENLKKILDYIHIKFCLLRPFWEKKNYPLVSPQELLPSFESNLFEYVDLPGFSMVVLDRTINYFQEIFQFDILHCVEDAVGNSNGPASPFEPAIINQNFLTFISRLPKPSQDHFKSQFGDKRVTEFNSYAELLQFLLHMDRGHVLSKNSSGDFYISGIYASFPSDLDSELKRYGLRMGKFRPGDNRLYELNRNFVYQFLMELYGFPIVSERRTSAALFARRLFKMGEDFMVRVLGQSDRTITSLYTTPKTKRFPQVEKIALVSVEKSQKEQLKQLREKGLLLEGHKPGIILKVYYRQHKYDPNNIRTDRALSVSRQEIIHPLTGEVFSNFNIIKDTNLMTVTLNDIVKGEFYGRVKYKRNEIVENTETVEKRLKFLYSWLRKHQRRIISYSDEFYNRISKVLDNYLLHPDNFEDFQGLNELYQEVWEQYSYIQQARKIKLLEDLQKKRYKGNKVNYLTMLDLSIKIVKELRFEIVKFFEELVEHAINICDRILNDNYLLIKYVKPPLDQLTDYGRQVRKKYGLLVKMVDDLNAIKNSRKEKRAKLAEKT